MPRLDKATKESILSSRLVAEAALGAPGGRQRARARALLTLELMEEIMEDMRKTQLQLARGWQKNHSSYIRAPGGRRTSLASRHRLLNETDPSDEHFTSPSSWRLAENASEYILKEVTKRLSHVGVQLEDPSSSSRRQQPDPNVAAMVREEAAHGWGGAEEPAIAMEVSKKISESIFEDLLNDFVGGLSTM